MSEQRLNNCFILHVYKEITDSCDMVAIAEDFIVGNSEHRHFFVYFHKYLLLYVTSFRKICLNAASKVF